MESPTSPLTVALGGWQRNPTTATGFAVAAGEARAYLDLVKQEDVEWRLASSSA
jgi:hypothetical protein